MSASACVHKSITSKNLHGFMRVVYLHFIECRSKYSFYYPRHDLNGVIYLKMVGFDIYNQQFTFLCKEVSVISVFGGGRAFMKVVQVLFFSRLVDF